MTDALHGATPDEPVHSHKVGILCHLGDGSVRLSGVGGPRDGGIVDRMYDVDDAARCARGETHPAPDPDCTCGFWSVPVRDELGWAFSRIDQTWVDLEVESFGRMVVHERGMRSERQRVLSVDVDDRCITCGRAATLLCADKPGPITPRCALHAASRDTGYCATAYETAVRLGTEVRLRRREWAPVVVPQLPERARRTRAQQVRAMVVAAGAVATLVALVVLGRSLTEPPTAPPTAVPVPVDEIASIADRAAAGEELTGWLDVGGQRHAVEPLVLDGQLAGVGVFSVATDGTMSCSIAAAEPVPAFVEALLPGSTVSGAWRVGQAAVASAGACLDWHDDVERVLGRTLP